MNLPIYQVDAFASKAFEGNPAAVIPLAQWLPDCVLQQIAEENNLSETAFFVAVEQGYELRWFTPLEEVDLCGHATLASAHVLFTHLNYQSKSVCFSTRSGHLQVHKSTHGYTMDFPATDIITTEIPATLLEGLRGVRPQEVLAGFDYIVVLESEAQVAELQPDFSAWRQLDKRGVVVTAQGENTDFVSRCFFPKLRVDEDPVTGSAHCELAPFWAKYLNKTSLVGKQLSTRTGIVKCDVQGARVVLGGQAVDYLKGEIQL